MLQKKEDFIMNLFEKSPLNRASFIVCVCREGMLQVPLRQQQFKNSLTPKYLMSLQQIPSMWIWNKIIYGKQKKPFACSSESEEKHKERSYACDTKEKVIYQFVHWNLCVVFRYIHERTTTTLCRVKCEIKYARPRIFPFGIRREKWVRFQTEW